MIQQRSGTQQTLEESPTELFPTCLSNYIQSNQQEDVLLALVDYLAPLVVASSGVIVVIPDTLGYGESYQFNRTYLMTVPSVQAWTVSFLAAQQYIRNVTGSCTELSQTTAVGGYGHGGYDAVLAAQALETLDIKVFQLYLGGAILKLQTQMSFWLQELSDMDASSATTYTRTSSSTGEDQLSASDAWSSRHYLESMAFLWTFSYSNNPSFSLASLNWRARILQLSAPDPSVPILYSNNDKLLDIINPDIVDSFEVRITNGRIQSFMYQYLVFHLTIVVVVLVLLYFA
jgi:hypothetical protein